MLNETTMKTKGFMSLLDTVSCICCTLSFSFVVLVYSGSLSPKVSVPEEANWKITPEFLESLENTPFRNLSNFFDRQYSLFPRFIDEGLELVWDTIVEFKTENGKVSKLELESALMTVEKVIENQKRHRESDPLCFIGNHLPNPLTKTNKTSEDKSKADAEVHKPNIVNDSVIYIHGANRELIFALSEELPNNIVIRQGERSGGDFKVSCGNKGIGIFIVLVASFVITFGVVSYHAHLKLEAQKRNGVEIITVKKMNRFLILVESFIKSFEYLFGLLLVMSVSVSLFMGSSLPTVSVPEEGKGKLTPEFLKSLRNPSELSAPQYLFLPAIYLNESVEMELVWDTVVEFKKTNETVSQLELESTLKTVEEVIENQKRRRESHILCFIGNRLEYLNPLNWINWMIMSPSSIKKPAAESDLNKPYIVNDSAIYIPGANQELIFSISAKLPDSILMREEETSESSLKVSCGNGTRGIAKVVVYVGALIIYFGLRVLEMYLKNRDEKREFRAVGEGGAKAQDNPDTRANSEDIGTEADSGTGSIKETKAEAEEEQ